MAANEIALLAEAVLKRLNSQEAAGSGGIRFTELGLHPEDGVALRRQSEDRMEIGPEGVRLVGLILRFNQLAIKPGWAELRGPEGDSWRFRWDPRFRCGRCGREIPNDEDHSPSHVVPYCPACSRIKRPGMYCEEV